MAHEIGVDGLVMTLSDAKPADEYRVIGNLVRLEQFSEILKHLLVAWRGILRSASVMSCCRKTSKMSAGLLRCSFPPRISTNRFGLGPLWVGRSVNVALRSHCAGWVEKTLTLERCAWRSGAPFTGFLR